VANVQYGRVIVQLIDEDTARAIVQPMCNRNRSFYGIPSALACHAHGSTNRGVRKKSGEQGAGKGPWGLEPHIHRICLFSFYSHTSCSRSFLALFFLVSFFGIDDLVHLPHSRGNHHHTPSRLLLLLLLLLSLFTVFVCSLMCQM